MRVRVFILQDPEFAQSLIDDGDLHMYITEAIEKSKPYEEVLQMSEVPKVFDSLILERPTRKSYLIMGRVFSPQAPKGEEVTIFVQESFK